MWLILNIRWSVALLQKKKILSGYKQLDKGFCLCFHSCMKHYAVGPWDLYCRSLDCLQSSWYSPFMIPMQRTCPLIFLPLGTSLFCKRPYLLNHSYKKLTALMQLLSIFVYISYFVLTFLGALILRLSAVKCHWNVSSSVLIIVLQLQRKGSSIK